MLEKIAPNKVSKEGSVASGAMPTKGIDKFTNELAPAKASAAIVTTSLVIAISVNVVFSNAFSQIAPPVAVTEVRLDGM